jgi:hypothetical protein
MDTRTPIEIPDGYYLVYNDANLSSMNTINTSYTHQNQEIKANAFNICIVNKNGLTVSGIPDINICFLYYDDPPTDIPTTIQNENGKTIIMAGIRNDNTGGNYNQIFAHFSINNYSEKYHFTSYYGTSGTVYVIEMKNSHENETPLKKYLYRSPPIPIYEETPTETITYTSNLLNEVKIISNNAIRFVFATNTGIIDSFKILYIYDIDVHNDEYCVITIKQGDIHYQLRFKGNTQTYIKESIINDLLNHFQIDYVDDIAFNVNHILLKNDNNRNV